MSLVKPVNFVYTIGMSFYRRYITYVHLQEVQDITHAHMHEQRMDRDKP